MAQKKEKQMESDNLSENPEIGKKAKQLEKGFLDCNNFSHSGNCCVLFLTR